MISCEFATNLNNKLRRHNQCDDTKVAKRTNNIIYGNFSSYEIKSVTQLRVNNHEKQCSSGLVTLSILTKDPK